MRLGSGNTPLSRFEQSYDSRRGVRLAICFALLATAGLLVWTTGRSGIAALRLLAQALATLLPLWRERGLVTPLVVGILLAQLVAMLTLWCLLGWAIAAVVRHSWRRRRRTPITSGQGMAWQRQQPGIDTDKMGVLPSFKFEASAALVTAGTGFVAHEAQTPSQPAARASAWSFETGPLPALSQAAARTSSAADRAAPLQLLVGQASDPGIRHRARPNEDNLVVLQGAKAFSARLLPFGFFAVADGVGGGTNGREASNMALQAMLGSVFPRLLDGDTLDERVLLEILTRAASHANRVLYQRNVRDASKLGTTLTAALVIGSQAYVVNVGDSRTYHYRASKGLQRVTSDHSIVARLVDAGIITAQDAYTHPQRSGIYRSLGKEPRLEVDAFVVQLQSGDSLLLCSDGLWEMVRDPHIEQLVGYGGDPMHICQALLSAALDAGGEDNVSVIVARLA